LCCANRQWRIKAPMGFYTHTHTHSLPYTHTHTHTHPHTHTYAQAHLYHSCTRSLSPSHAHKPTLSLSLTRTQTHARIQDGGCSRFRCNSVRSKLLLLWVIYASVQEPYMHTKKSSTYVRKRTLYTHACTRKRALYTHESQDCRAKYTHINTCQNIRALCAHMCITHTRRQTHTNTLSL